MLEVEPDQLLPAMLHSRECCHAHNQPQVLVQHRHRWLSQPDIVAQYRRGARQSPTDGTVHSRGNCTRVIVVSIAASPQAAVALWLFLLLCPLLRLGYDRRLHWPPCLYHGCAAACCCCCCRRCCTPHDTVAWVPCRIDTQPPKRLLEAILPANGPCLPQQQSHSVGCGCGCRHLWCWRHVLWSLLRCVRCVWLLCLLLDRGQWHLWHKRVSDKGSMQSSAPGAEVVQL
jgi:hypothetical protein